MGKPKKKSPARKTTKSSKKQVRKGLRPPKRTAAKPAARSASKPGSKPGLTNRTISFEGLSLRQIAARLSAYLTKCGYGPALIGKACAALHVGTSIKPKSLDLVLREYQVNELKAAMSRIGFRNTEMNTFESNRCPLAVVISPPPISVGDDIVDSLQIIKTRDGDIRTLDPTDCVRQLLSMYYRWGDRDAMEDAIAVASKHAIDLDLVRRWSEWEWCTDRFEEFLTELKKGS
ncbi:MAG: hypothetical protein WC956_05015 [bacterium]